MAMGRKRLKTSVLDGANNWKFLEFFSVLLCLSCMFASSSLRAIITSTTEKIERKAWPLFEIGVSLSAVLFNNIKILVQQKYLTLIVEYS